MEEPEKEEKTKEEPTNNDQPMEEKKNKNLSIKLILGIIILLLILFLFSIGCQEIQKRGKTVIDTNMQAIYPQEQIMEYGTHLTYQTILEKLVATNKLAEGTQIKVLVNDKLLREGEEYTLDTIGYLTFTVETSTPMPITSFLKQEVKASEQVVWKVEDTKKPVLSGVENKEIKKGEALDVKAGITAKDEVDGELPVTVEGTFDNNQVGEYTLTAKAVDKNQNEVTQTFTVTVKEETKKETTNTKNTSSNKTTTSKTTTNKTTSSNKTTTSKTTTSSNKTSTSNKKTTSSSSSSSKSTYTSTLKKRGYNRKDKNAAEKDKKATVIVNQIAASIKAKGYKTDLEKVQAAADAVSSYYYKGVHVESGYDYRTPYGVFVKGEASCAGTTRALIQVLEALGYKNLTHANENGWTHQWVILTMDGKKGFADGQVGMVGYGTHPYAS